MLFLFVLLPGLVNVILFLYIVLHIANVINGGIS
jgi:hypothetical protein